MKLIALITAILLGLPVLVKAQTAPVALTHVRIIDGTGAPPIENATIVMRDGIIVAAGYGVPVPLHAQIMDRSGMSALPGLVSDHSHVGQLEGVLTGSQFYTTDTITAELAQYRRYGVTTVTALGNNAPKVFDPMRKDAHMGLLPADLFGVDQGIGVSSGAPPVHVAPDQLFRPDTPEQARQDVDVMAGEGTDLVKIWVDDFNHSLPVKMDPAIIKAVVDEAHKKHLRVAAHIHDLDDAQRVVASGVDILAHGVRDKPVPDSFVQILKERGIWYIPTLQLDEATTAWAEQPAWVHAPYVVAGLSAPLRQQINTAAWQKDNIRGDKADFARTSLAINLQNLKTLWKAGVNIGFGTDSGAMPLRVPGVAEHRELALMMRAGLSPLQAIHIATQQAALLLNLHDRGVIAAGKRADLLVVAGNPATTIADADQVVETWENGSAVAGPAPVSIPSVPPITSNRDPAFGSVGQAQIIASITSPDPSGIAVVEGRLFLTFPKHDGDHAGPVLAEWKEGRLIPFPSAALSETSSGPAQTRLISPHGMTTDTAGNVWVIDDGKIKGQPIPAGGAKVVGFNPSTGQVIATVLLEKAMLPQSHMNDLRIDLTHGAKGTAYITDSSFDGHPALVVVDIATGRQRRVLENTVSVLPDPGYQTVLDGRVLHYDPAHPTFPAGGADGITLSADSTRVYYAPLASRRLYSLPTDKLADFHVSSASLAMLVVDEGEKGAADGLATDPWNRIYTTAADHDGVFRRNPDGTYDLIASDPRFVWPDGIFADQQAVYVVLGQWSRLPRLHDGQDMRKPPYLIARMPISPPTPGH